MAFAVHLQNQIAALKAENERLTKDWYTVSVERSELKARVEAAERALAERAGGVKVLSYGMKLIAEAITQHFGERDEYCEDDTTIQDAWDAFDALTTEPAAPEGRQEAEAERIKRGMEAILREQSERDVPFAPTTRPAEQAVKEPRRFNLGDRVTKFKGSSWTGRVVGFYSTVLTPVGYAVESETETGSVQIYPEGALTAALEQEGEG